MSTNPDGGPAFSRAGYINSSTGEGDNGCTGMTLRDWFAGQTIPALFTSNVTGILAGIKPIDVATMASDAYNLADAMLAERTKEKP